MYKSRRLPLSILIGFTAYQCGWDLLFREDEWMRALNANALQLAGSLLAVYATWRASRRGADRLRAFFAWLSAGTLFYLFSELEYLYRQIDDSAVGFNEFTLICGLLAYIFYFSALMNRIRAMDLSATKGVYSFNIVIFMVAAASISTHFIINPVLNAPSPFNLMNLISVAYPFATLSILLVTLVLYYFLKQQGTLNRCMRFIIWGMLCQVAADSSYAYLTQQGLHRSGDAVDLLWLLAQLLIGLGGFCALKSGNDWTPAADPDAVIKETYFPYVSVLVISMLVSDSYQWRLNALSLGLLALVLLIIVRQLHTTRVLNRLMGEYRYLAYHDPLTGLKNRIRFQQDLERIIGKTGVRAGLLLIDLDRFKVINDTLGHHAGDLILVQTAERLRRSVGARSPLYRLGGDEFVVILTDAENSWCAAAADRILGAFREPFRCEGAEIIVTPSIGISIYPDNGCTSNDLLKYADAAMYLAKESGKNSFRFYDTELHAIMARKMKLEHELRRAIDRRQFKLHYQPKFELRTKRIIGMEVLLRWEHPELGTVSPAEFIPVAEESGQIVAIGDWVLERACEQNKSWQDKGYPPLCVSVNVSVRQFQHREFLMSVRSVLQRTGLPAAYLELEITESIMQNVKESTEVLRALRRMGISISIDDFGTGYSSLFIIPKLPVDTIKIDKSFIDDIDDRVQLSMLKTIIDLGLSLNLGVVAEGIESEHQRQVLVAHGCPVGQGYLYSRPVSPEAFEEMLSAAGESGTNTEILSG